MQDNGLFRHANLYLQVEIFFGDGLISRSEGEKILSIRNEEQSHLMRGSKMRTRSYYHIQKFRLRAFY
jgi:hypothetical protein